MYQSNFHNGSSNAINRNININNFMSYTNDNTYNEDTDIYYNHLDASNNSTEDLYSDNNKISLTDVTVDELLHLYKHDSDLLKHLLIAKAEEDKVNFLSFVQ
ncbi:hypothetical protein BDF20DRAFT_596584 [Mycotypha africana]|uniref:uncharacterized protein n=1 Tax=Mycotypha africana TaxID=64632 RepID=UPI002301DDF3|nr:uncharacterized protein BDF20DRAFT_596584 [Mycotypha africana]KAI8975268.1 hypothetical protein BDF20DRAFT_596584 [Mycotypha africana]